MTVEQMIDEVKRQAVIRSFSMPEHGFMANKESSIAKRIVEQSALAEYFACLVYHAKYSNLNTKGGDGGYDFVLPKTGKTVEVKWLGYVGGTTTPRREGHILVRESRGLHADIYVAVIGDETTGFEIAGWCTQQELFDSPRFTGKAQKDGTTNNYAIHTSKLHKTKL